eukprot:TRINITY_DN15835_c0_g1_i1.p1 TRINITY_DN15835_c0_g1~~TRINITY_DN15835_c0_g1_i1.p1  ORF type:complete len:446 (+),score=98.23 TRINITY_DN15835_c0_g1_i1:31-1338(+)
MGDPNWQTERDRYDHVAITTMVSPTGDITTTMRSPRRGDMIPEHHIVHTDGFGAKGRNSIANDLKILSDLLNAGQLSQSEYDRCKAAIIGKLEGPIATPARIETPAALPIENGESRQASQEATSEQLPIPAPVSPARASVTAASLQANEYEVSEASPMGTVTGFTLLMCAEVYGNKINLELDFDNRPTVREVKEKAEQVFRIEADAVRQPEHPYLDMTFVRLQVYNDAAGTWCDLITMDQLKDFAQLYAFLPPSIWQTPGPAPSPQEIPPPTAARQAPNTQPLYAQANLRQYRVHYKGGTVPMRDRPSEHTACIMWVPDNTVVCEIAPSDGVWRFVEAEGRTGYIDKKFLTYLSEAPTAPEQLHSPVHEVQQARVSHPIHNAPVHMPAHEMQVYRTPAPPAHVPVSVSAHLYGKPEPSLERYVTCQDTMDLSGHD